MSGCAGVQRFFRVVFCSERSADEWRHGPGYDCEPDPCQTTNTGDTGDEVTDTLHLLFIILIPEKEHSSPLFRARFPFNK